MNDSTRNWSRPCNCAGLREAARHVSQLYDHHLAEAGLRNTQFTILVELQHSGPISINALAQRMVMDRTTLGRNILPLLRRRLIIARRSREDGRSKQLELSATGLTRLEAGVAAWSRAQAQFESRFGADRAAELRGLLQAIVGSDFTASPSHSPTGDQHE
jgi:DNA-binding MarR family transcriptional regulator